MELLEVPALATRSVALEKTVSRKGSRNFGLDIMRSLAILLVLMDHGEFLFYHLLPPFIANNVTLAGHWGVQMFFVLSGFLIGRLFIKEVSTKPLSIKLFVNFWKRRWFRTLPNYCLFLGLYTLWISVVPFSVWGGMGLDKNFMLSDWKELAYFPFFLQNFLVADISFFGHSWSLAVEEWFYLLLPLMVACTFILFKKQPLSVKLLYGFILFATLFVLIRTLALFQVWNGYTKLSVIYNLDNIMIGVICSWFFTFHKEKFISKRVKFFILAIPLFIIGFLFQNIFILTGCPIEKWDALIIPLQTISFALLLPWFYSIKIKRENLLTRLITEISKVSYSMYLIHFMLAFLLETVRKQYQIGESFACFILFLVITIGLSSLNYRIFELRLTNLRDKF